MKLKFIKFIIPYLLNPKPIVNKAKELYNWKETTERDVLFSRDVIELSLFNF